MALELLRPSDDSLIKPDILKNEHHWIEEKQVVRYLLLSLHN